MKNALRRNVPTLATIAVFLVIALVGASKYKGFRSSGVYIDLLRDNAFLGIAAVGLTFVILSGGIDLSVGAVIGFVSIFIGTVVKANIMHPALVILCALAIGTLFGAAMGWLISRFEIPPFLVTLGGLFLARGAAFLITEETIEITHPFYSKLGDSKLFLPILFLGVIAVGTIIQRYTPYGRRVMAIGGSESSSLLLGVPVRNTKVWIYALSGFCSSLAGVANTVYGLAGDPSAGTMLELDAIAAVVIGGTLLQGGQGSVLGTLFGVCLLGIIQTIITFDGTLSSWWTKIVVGALMFAFLLIQRIVEWVFQWNLNRRSNIA